MDYGSLKLAGTEDDDDDGDNEVAQNKLLRCENWNLCFNLSARERR